MFLMIVLAILRCFLTVSVSYVTGEIILYVVIVSSVGYNFVIVFFANFETMNKKLLVFARLIENFIKLIFIIYISCSKSRSNAMTLTYLSYTFVLQQ